MVPPPTSKEGSRWGAKAKLSTRRNVQRNGGIIFAELSSLATKLDEPRTGRLSEFLRNSGCHRPGCSRMTLVHVAFDQIIDGNRSRTEDHDHQGDRKSVV